MLVQCLHGRQCLEIVQTKFTIATHVNTQQSQVDHAKLANRLTSPVFSTAKAKNMPPFQTIRGFESMILVWLGL